MSSYCLQPGCSTRVERGYCREHKPRILYNDRRWKALRRQVLAEEPVCRICRDAWTHDVDHIETVKARPDLKLVRENLQGLCISCHSRKSAGEREADESGKEKWRA